MGELARGARHDARRVEDAERGDALRGRARVDAPRPRLDARRRRAARLEPPAPRHRVVGLAPQRVEAHLAVVLGALPLVLDDREAGRGLAAPRQALEHDDRRVLLDDAGGGADNSVVRERPRIARDLAAAGARRAVARRPGKGGQRRVHRPEVARRVEQHLRPVVEDPPYEPLGDGDDVVLVEEQAKPLLGVVVPQVLARGVVAPAVGLHEGLGHRDPVRLHAGPERRPPHAPAPELLLQDVRRGLLGARAVEDLRVERHLHAPRARVPLVEAERGVGAPPRPRGVPQQHVLAPGREQQRDVVVAVVRGDALGVRLGPPQRRHVGEGQAALVALDGEHGLAARRRGLGDRRTWRAASNWSRSRDSRNARSRSASGVRHGRGAAAGAGAGAPVSGAAAGAGRCASGGAASPVEASDASSPAGASTAASAGAASSARA